MFARRAADLRIRSMLSFQLYVGDGGVGALNLHGREPNAFDDDETIGSLLPATPPSASRAQQPHHAGQALKDRDVIKQAKGILMERHQIDAEHAFAIFIRASQDANLKLADIATVVSQTK